MIFVIFIRGGWFARRSGCHCCGTLDEHSVVVDTSNSRSEQSLAEPALLCSRLSRRARPVLHLPADRHIHVEILINRYSSKQMKSELFYDTFGRVTRKTNDSKLENCCPSVGMRSARQYGPSHAVFLRRTDTRINLFFITGRQNYSYSCTPAGSPPVT